MKIASNSKHIAKTAYAPDSISATNAIDAVVLLSGGLDSATVLAIVHSKGYKSISISFDYGQRHRIELAKAEYLAKIYKSKHITIKLESKIFQNTALVEANKIAVPNNSRSKTKIPITYVPARNILFLAHALAVAESYKCAKIFLGVTAVDYSGYPDCRPEFIESFQNMASLGTRCGVKGDGVKIEVPLLHLSKKDIILKGTELGLDYKHTSSCYQATAKIKSCQKCDSCYFRAQGFQEAGIMDPLLK